jgi:hypothetical protein
MTRPATKRAGNEFYARRGQIQLCGEIKAPGRKLESGHEQPGMSIKDQEKRHRSTINTLTGDGKSRSSRGQ